VAVTPAAVAFDLDGTLVLSETRNRVTWAAFFARYDIEVDEALLTHVTGRRGHDSISELLHLFRGRTIEQLAAEIWEVEAELDLPPIEPVRGAAELVRRIAATGTPLAVVTSAGWGYTETALAGLGVAELFPVVVTAEDVHTGKPDPEGYLLACSRLGVDPADALAFEDSLAGVAAVKAAGLRCIGVTTTQTAEALSAADAVVADLTQVDWPPSGQLAAL